MILDNFWTSLVVAALGFLLCLMAKVLFAAKTKPHANTQMLLPYDFFITLIVSFSLWSLLFFLLATAQLLEPNKEVIIIIASLLCPFLLWLSKKNFGSKN